MPSIGRRSFKPPVERVRGGFRLNLDVDERELLGRLLAELRDLLAAPGDDPVVRRLFPAAYHQAEHAAHDAEYRRLMHDELVASRLAGIETVEAALAARGPLDEGQVHALMQAINALRLVLGTVLDVGEDVDLDELPDDHPMFGEHHLYGFLSWLLEWTVRALQR